MQIVRDWVLPLVGSVASLLQQLFSRSRACARPRKRSRTRFMRLKLGRFEATTFRRDEDIQS
jgi:hypothetical protein